MGALADFAITEQYKGLIHYLLTTLFGGIKGEEYEELTDLVFAKLETMDEFKQYISEHYKGSEGTIEVVNNASQFVLIVENILLTRELEGLKD